MLLGFDETGVQQCHLCAVVVMIQDLQDLAKCSSGMVVEHAASFCGYIFL